MVGMTPDMPQEMSEHITNKYRIYSSASIFCSSIRIERILSNNGALLCLKISFACEGGSIAPFLPILHAPVQSTAIYPTTFSCAKIFLAIIDLLVS